MRLTQNLPPKENAFQNVTKARKLISLHQFSFSGVPFWKAFPFSVQQSRTGIFTQRYFCWHFLFLVLCDFCFWNICPWTLCPQKTLSSRHFVLRTLCPFNILSSGNFFLRKLYPQENLSSGPFFLRTLCPLVTLSFGHFCPLATLASVYFVLRRSIHCTLCSLNNLSSVNFVH